VIGRGATPALSASGRYVAFNDGKSGLVVRDRSTGLTEMISVDAAGMPLQGIAETPTISANGRFVSFLLMQRFPDTPKFEPRLYVRDRATQTTKLVATSAGNPTIAPDGRTIAYQGGIPGGAQDVIMLNLISGRTEVVSVSTRGGTENGPSFTGSGPLNTTGRFVAFFSDASNLVPRDTNHATDVFVRDRHARTTSLVSVSRAGP
jgi:Tol biopolymer transport system component